TSFSLLTISRSAASVGAGSPDKLSGGSKLAAISFATKFGDSPSRSFLRVFARNQAFLLFVLYCADKSLSDFQASSDSIRVDFLTSIFKASSAVLSMRIRPRKAKKS